MFKSDSLNNRWFQKKSKEHQVGNEKRAGYVSKSKSIVINKHFSSPKNITFQACRWDFCWTTHNYSCFHSIKCWVDLINIYHSDCWLHLSLQVLIADEIKYHQCVHGTGWAFVQVSSKGKVNTQHSELTAYSFVGSGDWYNISKQHYIAICNINYFCGP